MSHISKTSVNDINNKIQMQLIWSKLERALPNLIVDHWNKQASLAMAATEQLQLRPGI